MEGFSNSDGLRAVLEQNKTPCASPYQAAQGADLTSAKLNG